MGIKKVLNENQELVKVLMVGLVGVGVFVLCIMIYYLNIHSAEDYYIDEVSGQKVSTMETGDIVSDDVKIIGLNDLVGSGLDVEVSENVKEIVGVFLRNTMPNVNTLSYKRDSLEMDGNVVNFKMVTNDKKEFSFSISQGGVNDYKMTIYYNDGIILDYDASKIVRPTNNPSNLDGILPYTIEANGVKVSLSTSGKGRRKRYIIAVDSCGDVAIKNEAMKVVRDWLEKKGYNYDDFNFEIPDYCDGSAS